MATSPEIITRLGYDPTDLRKGLVQAKQDVARYKAEATLLEEQLRRERVRLNTEFSRENKKQVEERIAQIRQELAQKISALSRARGAEKQATKERITELRAEFNEQQKTLKGFDDQVKKVAELTRARQQLTAAASRSQAAAGVFRETGRATGEIPGLSDILQQSGLARVSPQLAEIVSRISAIGSAAGGSAAGISRLGGAALGTVGIIGALAAAAASAGIAIAKSAIETGKWADQLEDTAVRTGFTAEQVRQFEFIGKTTDLTIDDLITGMRGLSRAIAEGNPGFARLGVATRNANGDLRDQFDVLLDLADGFRDVRDPQERIVLAQELFSRSGQRLLPTLVKGSEHLRELIRISREYRFELEPLSAQYSELEIAQARAEAAGRKLAAQQSEFIPLWTRMQIAWANFRSGLAEDTIESRQRSFTFGPGVAAPPPALPLPPSPAPPGIPPQFSTDPGRTPFEPEEVRQVRAKLEQQRAENARKELSDLERLRVARADLLKLQREESKITEPDLKKKNLEQQLALETEIGNLQKTNAAAVRRAAQELIEAQQRENELLAERTRALSAVEIKNETDHAGRLAQIRERLEVVDRELAVIREREAVLRATASNAALPEKQRLEAQKSLNEAIQKGTQFIREQGELSQQQVDAIAKTIGALPLGKRPDLTFTERSPDARAIHVRDFAKELGELRVQEALGVTVLNQELSVREALNKSLIDQIRLRLAAGAATDEERRKLEALLSDLRQNREAISKIKTEQFKLSGLGQFVDAFREFSGIVGKFSAALNRTLGQVFALAEGIGAVVNQLRLLGGGTRDAQGNVTGGSFLSGLRNIFRRGSGLSAGSRLGGLLGLLGTGIGGAQLLTSLLSGGFSGPGRGALTGGLLGAGGLVGLGLIGTASAGIPLGAALPILLSNPLTAIAGIAGATIGGLLGAQRKKTRRIAQQIKDEIKESLTAFNEGRSNLRDTIGALEQERADAIRRLSGKKGGSKELQPILSEIDKQLGDLRRRQKEILEEFNTKVALLGVPEGARDAAEAIASITRELKAAADAGATAQQQIEFLNRSLADLKVKIGRELRNEEQETLDLLLQQIDLTKQREQIEKDAAEAERNVRQRFGLERALTPEQQAALEIRKIREQKAERLKALDEEEKRLQAQLEGRAELFGFSLEELDAAGARERILARQLEIERQITAEIVARISEQRQVFEDLAAGRIPALPAGLLPPGFAFPQGAGVTFSPGAVVINIGAGGGGIEPREIREEVVRAFEEIAARRGWGQSA